MLACKKPDPFCEFVISRLIQAGWLQGYTFREGVGYLLHWTKKGSQRALLLQDICKTYEVSPASAKAFTTACRADDGPVPKQAGEFWMECLGELKLSKEVSTLAIFVKASNSAECALQDVS